MVISHPDDIWACTIAIVLNVMANVVHMYDDVVYKLLKVMK